MARLKTLEPRLTALDTRRVKPAPKRAEPFYLSAAWRSLMAALIAERGRRCEECGRTSCRIFGDHIVELRDGGAPLDPSNVMLRCGSCHTAKTARARAERMRSPSKPLGR
jgi:5-methylcytosine-specific restriction protein A